MFKVAIVGRPNVGKTTLFNKIIGKKHAIIHNTPGVTRDRKEQKVDFFGMKFLLTDSAGLEMGVNLSATLYKKMAEQTINAIKEADLCLFMVDGRVGITTEDREVARTMQRQKKQAILVVNKSESENKIQFSKDFYSLGFNDEMVFISAEHNHGFHDLFLSIREFYDKYTQEYMPLIEDEDGGKKIIKVALIGRPNVGKSSILNAILGYNRVVTHDVAGTTRDSIAIDIEYNDYIIRMIDTAGIRKKMNIDNEIEQMSVEESFKVIDFAHIIIFVCDPTMLFDQQDLALISKVTQEGRGLIIVINKWDKIASSSKKKVLDTIQSSITNVISGIFIKQFITLSALYDKDVKNILRDVIDLYTLWNAKIPTSKLNKWLEEFREYGRLPKIKGKGIKLKFITQSSIRPPCFKISTNFVDVGETFISYLRRNIIEKFNLFGLPVRLLLQKNDNPYVSDNQQIAVAKRKRFK